MPCIRLPSKYTLRKYGITESEWLQLWHNQGEICPICERSNPELYLVIDHEHVKGWKKMQPKERKKFIRGICCNYCNRWTINKTATLTKLANGARYLQEYEKRKQK